MKKRINISNWGTDYLFYAFIIFAGVSLIYHAASDGQILTNDSRNYLHAASTFREFGLFLSPNGTPSSSWPPLFSLILSILPSPVRGSILFFSILIYVVNCILLIVISKEVFTKRFLHITFIGLAVLGISQIMIHTFLWSEPFFITILFVVLIILKRHLNEPSNKWLVMLIIAVNILCLHRNAGIFIIPGLGLSIFLYGKGNNSLIRAGIFLVLGSITFVCWNIYTTYYFSDGFHVLDNDYFGTFWTNSYNTLNIISAWLLPREVPIALRVILLLSATLAFFIFAETKISNKWLKSVMLILAVYLLCLNVIGELYYYDIERYLSVIYPLMIMVFVYMLSLLEEKVKTHYFKYFIIIGIVCWGFYVISRSAKNTLDWHKRSALEYQSAEENYNWLEQ